jgi:hypothetical protein
MVCFCKNTTSKLQLALPQLVVAADLNLTVAADLSASLAVIDPAAAALQSIAGWLAALGLPAAPWQPDPAWLDLPLPTLSLNANAMATISAFAQLRADMLAQFGIDLLIPAQATALVRLVATLSARLSAVLAVDATLVASLTASAKVWAQLSATLIAVAQVEAALALNLLPTPPPPGPPLSLWRAFLQQLRALLPLIAVAAQLNLDLTADISVQLAAMLRVMLRIQLPALNVALPMPALSLMANLTATLSAVAQLRLALGVDPLVVGVAEVRAMVAARVTATARLVEQTLGLSLPALLAALLQLPRPPYCATLMAPPAVIKAVMSIIASGHASALAAISWQVPAVASLPVLSVGLPVVSLTAQLNAALGLTASLTPCGSGCDAAALTRALAA